MVKLQILLKKMIKKLILFKFFGILPIIFFLGIFPILSKNQKFPQYFQIFRKFGEFSQRVVIHHKLPAVKYDFLTQKNDPCKCSNVIGNLRGHICYHFTSFFENLKRIFDFALCFFNIFLN